MGTVLFVSQDTVGTVLFVSQDTVGTVLFVSRCVAVCRSAPPFYACLEYGNTVGTVLFVFFLCRSVSQCAPFLCVPGIW